MKLQDLVNNLVQSFEAEENSFESSQWPDFKLGLQGVVDDVIKEQVLTQQLFELSYSEFQKMWDLVAEREALIKAVFDASPDIIFTLDKSGQVTGCNQSFHKMVGQQAENTQGKFISNFITEGTFAEELRSCFNPVNESHINEFCSKSQEMTLTDHQQTQRIVFVSPHIVTNGKERNYAFYVRDLTAERAALNAVEESRMMLMSTAKMSALGEMAGGIAHEINTPIATIQMRTDQLFDELDSGVIDKDLFRSALTSIDSTVKRISRIINGLRSFARDGRLDSPANYPLDTIVNDTLGFCQERFQSHGVHIEVTLDGEFHLVCRPAEISQVLLNLLNNSFDAIASLPEKWIKIEAHGSHEQVQISVTDSGPGIPEPVRSRLMQPFFTTKEIGKGTGLGLSISRGIVESHHGKLDLDAAHAHTRFVLTFPLGASPK